jgi:thioredoxin-related protein
MFGPGRQQGKSQQPDGEIRRAAVSFRSCCSEELRVVLRTLVAFLLVVSLILTVIPTSVFADELTIGGQLHGFRKLPAVDGKEWSFDDFSEAKVLVVMFISNRCPYSVDYEGRLSELQQYCSMSKECIQLLAVNSNYGRDESLAGMLIRSREREFEFPYVKDEDQSVARTFGAVYTPEFFVFDQDRKLVYKGALDDATNAAAVEINYVKNAIDAVRTGASVEVPEVGARGCTIRFKRRGRAKSSKQAATAN